MLLSDYELLEELMSIYEKEILKKVKNKRRIYRFELYKMEFLMTMHKELQTGTYDGGQYNLFLVHRPKLRLIMSQNIYDKTVNHFVTRNILEPKLSKYLHEYNAATRKDMGTSFAVKLLKKHFEYNKRYDDIYVLKLDIKKYFYTIDHEVLKNIIQKDLNDDEYKLICKIIDSTNAPYINNIVERFNQKYNDALPYYKYGKGLPIGNMSSQFLAILYLSDLHRYITEDLNLKHLVVYMDDYLIVHHDKEYLKKCLKIIKYKIENEYKLEVSDNKTIIRNVKYGINFLGYSFRVINKKTIVKITKDVRRKLRKNIKKVKYEVKNNYTDFEAQFSSIMNYMNSYIYANKYEINKIIDKYWY